VPRKLFQQPVHRDPEVIEALTILLAAMKADGIPYFVAIQILIDELIEAGTLYTHQAPQFFEFVLILMGDVKSGVRIAVAVWEMLEWLAKVAVDSIKQIIEVNCRR